MNAKTEYVVETLENDGINGPKWAKWNGPYQEKKHADASKAENAVLFPHRRFRVRKVEVPA